MAELALIRQRCFNHAGREAAARCTGCLRYFCRECAVEYENRLVCASCLQRLGQTAELRRTRFASMRPWLAAALGFMLAWAIFYMVGLTLVTMI